LWIFIAEGKTRYDKCKKYIKRI